MLGDGVAPKIADPKESEENKEYVTPRRDIQTVTPDLNIISNQDKSAHKSDENKQENSQENLSSKQTPPSQDESKILSQLKSSGKGRNEKHQRMELGNEGLILAPKKSYQEKK